MKVCVYGPGAVGGFIAAILQQAGCDISVVARGEALASIRKSGLKIIQDGTGDLPPRNSRQ